MKGGVSFKTYLLAFLAIVLWGMSYIWNDRLIGLGIPMEYFVFVRSVIGGAVLLVFNLVTGADLRIRRADIPKFALLAFCEPFVNFLAETHGIALTESPSYSAMITATAPLISIAAGLLFFGERLSALNYFGFGLTVGGIMLSTFTASEVGPMFVLGVVLLVIGAASDVGLASCTKMVASSYRPSVIVMYQFLIGAVFFAPLFATVGLKDYDPVLYMSFDVWEPVLCLALLCTCVSFSLWAMTIKDLGVARSCVLLSMIPVVTAVAGEILGSEHLGMMQWAGIVVACVGIVLSQLQKK